MLTSLLKVPSEVFYLFHPHPFKSLSIALEEEPAAGFVDEEEIEKEDAHRNRGGQLQPHPIAEIVRHEGQQHAATGKEELDDDSCGNIIIDVSRDGIIYFLGNMSPHSGRSISLTLATSSV